MAVQECANGHLYDTDQYASCPYCAGGGNRIDFGAGMDSGVGKTVAGGMASQPVGETVAPSGYRSDATDTGKTVGVFQKKMSYEPVVGWLVCIEGPEKGKDYRIYAKNNSIGRGEQSDIVLKGDTSISRENHARLAFDRKHSAYHIIPGNGANTVYLNDEPVYVPTKLKPEDMLEIGDFKMIFISFPTEKYNWNDDNKNHEAE